MNGVPIEVIPTMDGVEVVTPKSRTFIKTDEATFRLCYERGLALADFGSAKAELYKQQYEIGRDLAELIKTELLVTVLSEQFRNVLSGLHNASNSHEALAILRPEMFKSWLGILFVLEKIREFHPCRRDVAEALLLAMLKITQAQLSEAQNHDARARL